MSKIKLQTSRVWRTSQSLCAALLMALTGSAEVVCYEYLAISGGAQQVGAYLLTDYVPKSNTVIRTRFRSSSNSTTSNNQMLFCSRKLAEASTAALNFCFFANASGKFRFDYYDTQTKAAEIFTANRYYDLEVRGGKAYVTDTLTSQMEEMGPGLKSFSPQYRMAFFKSYTYSNNAYGSLNNSFKGRFCYMRISEIEDGEEVLKHYYVPCKEDGIVKLCDLAVADRPRYELTVDSGVTVNVAGPQILYPDLISDYSTISCDRGPLELPLLSPEGTIGWTFADMTNFAAQATWTSYGYYSPSAQYTESAGGVRQIPAFLAGAGAGIGTDYDVSLTNISTLAGGKFGWHAGTAYLAEPLHVALDEFTIHNVDGTSATFFDTIHTPRVVLDGGITLEGGANAWYVGPNGGTSVAPTNAARLVVKNATLINNTISQSPANSLDSALVIGGGASWAEQPGILEVQDGAIISNKLFIGGVSGAYGYGMARQSGGQVFVPGATSDWRKGPGIGIGNSSNRGHGHYDLTGGSFTAFGSFSVGGGGIGTWRQTGGVAHFTKYPGSDYMHFGLGTMNGGWGSVYLAGGGTMKFDGSITVTDTSSGSGRCLIVADGAGTEFAVSGAIKKSANLQNVRTSIAIRNGGRIKTRGIYRNASNPYGKLYISFDNGTYVNTNSYTRMFANYENSVASRANAVIVRQGGMTVDTGESNTTSLNITVPVQPPFGGGVESVPLDSPLSGASCLLPPFVDVVGDGMGAVVMPIWDADTSTVSGFTVVDPGVGYTVATAMVYKTQTTKIATIECTVSETPNAGKTGSFTKKGAGEIELACTNTWGGATIVRGGRLKCTSDWAVPGGSEVVLAGGELDFNGKTGSVSRIVYGPGGGAIKNAQNVALPASWDMTISIDEILSGSPIAFTDDVNLSDRTLTITGDCDKLDEEQRYIVATTAAGKAFAGLPTVVGLPEGWKIRVRGNRLVLAKERGFCIILL